jgi:hypothetical protein
MVSVTVSSFRTLLVVGVLSVAPLSAATAAKTPPAQRFGGHWTYSNDCQFGHYVDIDLVQNGASVTGSWSDGTRVEGWDGLLNGNIRDGKLHAKYCGTEANSGHAVCPGYDANESDYFARRGHDLVWYKSVGHGADRSFEKYAVLHPSAKGEHEAVAGDCPDGQN